MMKHLLKMLILVLALLLTTIVHVVGLSDMELQDQIGTAKIGLISAHKSYKPLHEQNIEVSDINSDYESYSEMENSYDESSIVVNRKLTNEHYNVIKEESSDISNNYIYNDISNSYYGRLYIPDLNINVALYYGHQQYITDRVDSANICFFGDSDGFTIADHNNQEFSKLFGVYVGAKGYIEHRDFGRINIRCVDVFDGYNIKKDIVDENNISATNRADYMMYTCRDISRNVFICLWDVVS